MIIDQLPNLASVQETDEIPVERGTTTYKSTLQKLKDLVASLLSKSDVGLGNVDNVRQYSAQNPPPYPVTSVNGETGAVSVYSRTLLWTNPTPDTLAAGTVNVNMDGYDNIEIECTRNGDTSKTYFVRSGIGTSSRPVTVDLTSIYLETENSNLNAITLMTRTADVYSTGIVFSSGKMIYNGELYKDWDSRAVPYRIWGIKY